MRAFPFGGSAPCAIGGLPDQRLGARRLEGDGRGPTGLLDGLKGTVAGSERKARSVRPSAIGAHLRHRASGGATGGARAGAIAA